MKLFHVTDYKLYNKNVINDFRVCIINDLHFSYRVNDITLNYIIDNLKRVNPDYIFIPGDLIDSINMIDDDKEKERLVSFVTKLGRVGITIISLGNHDRYRKVKRDSNNKFKWSYDNSNNIFNEINSISNVYVLDNELYKDERVYVVGLTLSNGYYHSNNSNLEDKEELLKEIKELKNNLIYDIPKDRVKIMLVHSPVYLQEMEVISELEEFDYFISGHMHNGLVPPVINELWNSTKGFIAPDRRLFSDNERNTLKNREDKLIVNGPIVTFHECTGILHIFNLFYPKYMSILNFTNNISYDKDKILVKRRYNR